MWHISMPICQVALENFKTGQSIPFSILTPILGFYFIAKTTTTIQISLEAYVALLGFFYLLKFTHKMFQTYLSTKQNSTN